MFKRLLASVLILLFVALSYNKVSNWHTHTVNGVVVQHAHANSDNPQQKHSHTATDFSIISVADSNFWNQIQLNFLPQVFEQKIQISEHLKIKVTDFVKREFSNKSPPCFLDLL